MWNFIVLGNHMFVCELMSSVWYPELGLLRFACENVYSGGYMISHGGGGWFFGGSQPRIVVKKFDNPHLKII